jgi:hypothetical protein
LQFAGESGTDEAICELVHREENRVEFELVELPQAPDLNPGPMPFDPRVAQRQRDMAPRRAADWRDQAVLIPDQEYGS